MAEGLAMIIIEMSSIRLLLAGMFLLQLLVVMGKMYRHYKGK